MARGMSCTRQNAPSPLALAFHRARIASKTATEAYIKAVEDTPEDKDLLARLDQEATSAHEALGIAARAARDQPDALEPQDLERVDQVLQDLPLEDSENQAEDTAGNQAGTAREEDVMEEEEEHGGDDNGEYDDEEYNEEDEEDDDDDDNFTPATGGGNNEGGGNAGARPYAARQYLPEDALRGEELSWHLGDVYRRDAQGREYINPNPVRARDYQAGLRRNNPKSNVVAKARQKAMKEAKANRLWSVIPENERPFRRGGVAAPPAPPAA